MDLCNFGHRCRLFMHCYASHNVFKIQLIKYRYILWIKQFELYLQKIWTGNNIRILLCGLVRKWSMFFVLYSIENIFWANEKYMFTLLLIVQLKQTKMCKKVILSIDLNVFEFFLCTDQLSDLHKKFQVASLYDFYLEKFC